MIQINHVEFILYVACQSKSTEFYTRLFRKNPDLNVNGMTEFILNPTCKIGIMPSEGIAKILGKHMPHPNLANGIPRCEMYFNVENIELEFEHAMQSGAKLISPILERNWGDKVCYFTDLDGHIIAFSKKI